MQSAKCNRCGGRFVHTSRTGRPSQMHEDQVGSLHLCPDFMAFSELMQFQWIWCLWSVVKLGGLRIWGRSPNFLIPMGMMSTGFMVLKRSISHKWIVCTCYMCTHVYSNIYIYIVQGPLPKSSLFAVAQNRTRNDSRGTFHPESHHSWNVPFCTLINRVCDCRVSNNFKLCFGHDSPACFKCRAKHEPIAFGQPPFNQIGLTSSPALIILNLTSSTLQK